MKTNSLQLKIRGPVVTHCHHPNDLLCEADKITVHMFQPVVLLPGKHPVAHHTIHCSPM